MLVGGDDVSNDVSSIFHMVSMFVYIHTCFRFALIGGNLTAQAKFKFQRHGCKRSFLFLPPRGYSGFQVTGMIEGFLGGLKFSIPGFFWVRKFGKNFLG